LFLRRPVGAKLTGFASYTLAWATASDVARLTYTPIWDIRHVLNLALHWQIGAALSLGVRAFVRSGRVAGTYFAAGEILARDERRLPGFFRFDVELAYHFRPSWGRMRLALEWWNATLSKEPSGLGCDAMHRDCSVEYLPALFFPNLSLRAER
jgi:hypothetical protein